MAISAYVEVVVPGDVHSRIKDSKKYYRENINHLFRIDNKLDELAIRPDQGAVGAMFGLIQERAGGLINHDLRTAAELRNFCTLRT